MHPDPPSNRYGWGTSVREVAHKKSFDDQYLDELKTLRNPNYVPEPEPEPFVFIKNGRVYTPVLWEGIKDQMEQLYVDHSEL